MTLLEEYEAAVEEPATVTLDFRQDAALAKETAPTAFVPLTTEAIRPVPLLDENSSAKRKGIEDGFVIANLVTPDECQALIDLAETDGIVPPSKAAGTPRTAKRTDRYQNKEISDKIAQRLKPILEKQFASTTPKDWHGPFSGVHSNWRIVRYDPGDAFPAHQDQMDSIQELDKATGKKEFLVSTHTLLIQLTPGNLQGGATRFYPKAKLGASDATSGHYDESIDVILPQGWALAFPQLGLVHAGQPVSLSEDGVSKYVAQAGLLRTLPPGKLCRPSVFKPGPGIPRA